MISQPCAIRRHWPLLVVTAIAVVGRLWQVHESLWLDELHTAWVVSGGVGEIAERARFGNQSPLYFYLPWGTTSLFGMSEWTLRTPSLLAGLGVVVVSYVLCWRFTRSLIAATSVGLLAAMDRNFLFYSTEARPYAWVQLAAAVQLWFFWRLQVQASVARRAAYVAGTVLLFYLHYTAILVVAGQVVLQLGWGWLDRSTARDRRIPAPDCYRARHLAADLAMVLLLVIPNVWHLLEIAGRRDAWAAFVNRLSFHLAVIWFSLDGYVLLCVVATVVVLLMLRVSPERALRRVGADKLCLLCGWFAIPLAVTWIATATGIAPLFFVRYLVGVALAPLLLSGQCVATSPRRLGRIAVAVIVVAYTLYAHGIAAQYQYDGRLFGDRRQDWRAAVDYVNEANTSKAFVFVRSDLLEADRLRVDPDEQLRAYCLLPVTSIYNLNATEDRLQPLPNTNAGCLNERDLHRISESGAWFVINGQPAARMSAQRQVLRSTKQQGVSARIVNEREFGDVAVWRLALDQPTSPSSKAAP